MREKPIATLTETTAIRPKEENLSSKHEEIRANPQSFARGKKSRSAV